MNRAPRRRRSQGGRAAALALAALAIGTLAAMAAQAQPTGQAQSTAQASHGRAIADARCAACHAIDRGQPHSPHADAPPFAAIAATPGMTETALLAALRTSHRTMPNLILDDADTRAIIAYILSLKSAR